MAPRQLLRLVSSALLASVCFACDGGGKAPGKEKEGVAAAPCAGLVGAEVTRVVPHWGAGHEALLRGAFEGGAPLPVPDPAACVRFEDEAGRPIAATVAPRSLPPGYTALLVDPGDGPGDRGLVRDMLDELVGARPAAERVAVYRWGAEAQQVVTFSDDHPYILERWGEGVPLPAARRQPLAAALAAVAPVLGAVGGTAPTGPRTLIVVSPRSLDVVDGAVLEAARPHLLLWIGPGASAPQVAALPPGHRFGYDLAGGGPRAAAAAASARIDEYRARGFFGVGVCGTDAFVDGRVHVGGSSRPFFLPAVMNENRGGTCTPGALARGERQFSRRIDLSFSPEQRARAEEIFGRAFGITAGDAKERFPLQVRLGPDQAPASALARYRGQSSFGCSRRNYTVRLEGRAPRFLMPGSSSRRFHLVSMCLDRLYVNNVTALRVMADVGLFPVPFELLELTIDGASGGVYLVSEDVDDALVRQYAGVTSVIRRFGANDTFYPEVKFTIAPAEDIARAWNGLLDGTEMLAGIPFEQAVRKRLALDQYFGWLALMTLLGSGDYGDEVFFVSTQSLDAEGNPIDHWSVVGWDQDDIFSPCRRNGATSFMDPHGMVVCAEADLDKRLLADPYVYGRYVAALERMLMRVPPAAFRKALQGSAERLLSFFERPETLAAMVELQALHPGPITYAVAKDLLDAEVATLTAKFDANHAALLEKVKAWKAGPAPAPSSP